MRCVKNWINLRIEVKVEKGWKKRKILYFLTYLHLHGFRVKNMLGKSSRKVGQKSFYKGLKKMTGQDGDTNDFDS